MNLKRAVSLALVISTLAGCAMKGSPGYNAAAAAEAALANPQEVCTWDVTYRAPNAADHQYASTRGFGHMGSRWMEDYAVHRACYRLTPEYRQEVAQFKAGFGLFIVGAVLDAAAPMTTRSTIKWSDGTETTATSRVYTNRMSSVGTSLMTGSNIRPSVLGSTMEFETR